MIPAYYYYPIFLYTVIALTVIMCMKVVSDGYKTIRHNDHSFFTATALAVAFTIFLGGRNTAPVFGDSFLYAHQFDLMKELPFFGPNEGGEWMWLKLMYTCSQIGDYHLFFMVVESLYFGLTLWACKRMMPNQVLIAFLFCLGAFSFYSYSVNGIRNGLGSSIMLLAISFAKGKATNKVVALLLPFVAVNVHRSAIIPTVMLIASMWFIRSFKWSYTFWIISILISLILGNWFINFFISVGFDDRMRHYGTLESEQVSHSFRWDFLVYSMMPIVLGYYVVIKRGIRDKFYELLLNTYTLSNAFWVIVIRAAFSNRFAYLSWFMYPIVLAYPLLKLNIWGRNQGKNLAYIMFAHVAFTWFMEFVYG